MLWRRRKHRASPENMARSFLLLAAAFFTNSCLVFFGDHAMIPDPNFLSICRKLSVISLCSLHRGGICAGRRRCSRGRGIITIVVTVPLHMFFLLLSWSLPGVCIHRISCSVNFHLIAAFVLILEIWRRQEESIWSHYGLTWRPFIFLFVVVQRCRWRYTSDLR